MIRITFTFYDDNRYYIHLLRIPYQAWASFLTTFLPHAYEAYGTCLIAADSQYEDIYLGSLSLSMMEDIHIHTYEILSTMI